MLIAAWPGAAILLAVYKYTTPQKRLKAIQDEIKSRQETLAGCVDDPSTFYRTLARVIGLSFKALAITLPGGLLVVIPMLALLLALDPWMPAFPLGQFRLFGFRPDWYWIYMILCLAAGWPMKRWLKIA